MNIDLVVFEDLGEIVKIGSGGMMFEINKSSAQVLSAKWDGSDENLMHVNGRDNYFVLNYQIDGVRHQFNPGEGDLTYHGAEKTEDFVKFMLCLDNPELAPFRIEMNFCVMAGVSGLYFYSVYNYTDSMPDKAAIEQDRYALYVNGSIFNHYKLGENREGILPRPKDLKKENMVMDATYELEEGGYYTKYAHINFEYENDLYGLFGKGLGAFIIKPYSDYFNGGPTRQDLTLHQTETSPILLWHGHTGHYGRTKLVPNQGWSKVFGPVLFYFNQSESMTEAWSEAKGQLMCEKDQWPRQWMDSSEHMEEFRGSVTGKVSIGDDAYVKNGMAVLGAPSPDWQLQSEGYSYHAEISRDGTFEIPHVREGDYTLYIFADGHIGQYLQDNVRITAGEMTGLKDIWWQPDNYGKLLWQIGEANRTAKDYYGGEDYHRWGQWFDYNNKFKDGVLFEIGQSVEKEDFNYYQPKWDLSLDNLVSAEPWIILFDLNQCYNGNGLLTLALAGVVLSDLKVELNDNILSEQLVLPPVPNDNSLYRSSNHGVYRVQRIEFSADLLVKGKNELKLTLVSPENVDLWMTKYASILYDCIRLEVDTKDK